MDDAEPDVLAYMTFPKEHRAKLHSTDKIERLDGEIKRRTEVVGIFPNDRRSDTLVTGMIMTVPSDPPAGDAIFSAFAAIIVLHADRWKRFASDNGLDPALPNHAASKIKVIARITQLLMALPKHAQVRALHLTLQPWTVESGLLTPTFKVKRDVFLPRYAKEISELYAED